MISSSATTRAAGSGVWLRIRRSERCLPCVSVDCSISSTFLLALIALALGGNRASAQAAPTCDGLLPTITGSGVINGTSGNDVIIGSAGSDTINGGSGNDTICGGGGNDSVSGGSGNDRMWGEVQGAKDHANRHGRQ